MLIDGKLVVSVIVVVIVGELVIVVILLVVVVSVADVIHVKFASGSKRLVDAY